MICPHCSTFVSDGLLPAQSVEGGRAYAERCPSCGHVLHVRPRTQEDPPLVPADLSLEQIARLRFLQWRLHEHPADHDGAA